MTSLQQLQPPWTQLRPQGPACLPRLPRLQSSPRQFHRQFHRQNLQQRLLQQRLQKRFIQQCLQKRLLQQRLLPPNRWGGARATPPA